MTKIIIICIQIINSRMSHGCLKQTYMWRHDKVFVKPLSTIIDTFQSNLICVLFCC